MRVHVASTVSLACRHATGMPVCDSTDLRACVVAPAMLHAACRYFYKRKLSIYYDKTDILYTNSFTSTEESVAIIT